MITFQNKQYELFFSNNLAPLTALNYADELFFQEFEKLCGNRYRILVLIRNSWQNKYILSEDLDVLKKNFELKIDDEEGINNILNIYEKESKELRELLLIENNLAKIRKKSALLDAMSNMLHLFSSLVGYEFFKALHNYSKDKEIINKNFVYYTQPIKGSRFAKLIDIDHKLKLSKRDNNFSKILRIGSFVKDDVSELLDIRNELLKKIKIKGVEYLQLQEIEDIKNKDFFKLIQDRKKLTVLFYSEKKLKIYEGNNAEHFIKEGNFKEIITNNKTNILKGQIASLGKATGRIVIANNSREAIEKIKEGDILVAPYTAVEYLPAMKKSAAIITETGGITSHAAIISRELNIPCIIGVKDATKILKNNQKVDVDADEGTIKII